MVPCVVTMSVCKGPPLDRNGSKAHISGGGNLYLDAFSCLANTAAVMERKVRGAMAEWFWKIEVLGGKPVPGPLHPL